MQLGGPAVIFFLVPVLGYSITKPAPTFDIYFVLEGLKSADNPAEMFVVRARIGTLVQELKFNGNGQADWRDLPESLKDSKVIVMVENKSDRYLVPKPRFEATLIEPYTISVVVSPLTDDQLRRINLKGQFHDVLNEIKLIFIEKKTLERALSRYIDDLSVENWADVRRKASDMAEQIRRGVELARQFDVEFGGQLSEFKPLVANISTANDEQSKSIDTNFTEARQDWEEKEFINSQPPKMNYQISDKLKSCSIRLRPLTRSCGTIF